MAIEYTQLIEPTELTTGLSLFIIFLYIIFAWIALRLYHALLLLTWAVSILVLAMTVLVDLPFIWFWILILVMALEAGLAGIFRFLPIGE